MTVESLTSDPVETAFSALRAAFEAKLRAEQLRDRLTGLGNKDSLTEWLREAVEYVPLFWMAFVEVDKFKSINEEFDHHNADKLLQRIAECLRAHVKSESLPAGSIPFRPHGDEFYIVGSSEAIDQARLFSALDELRADIARIRIPHERRQMHCTVSIGWLVSTDAQKGSFGLTIASVLTYLELAVEQAKWAGRNTVVQFTPAMQKAEVRNGRADCNECFTRFTVTIPIGGEKSHELKCPNCYAEVLRPPGLKPKKTRESRPKGGATGTKRATLERTESTKTSKALSRRK